MIVLLSIKLVVSIFISKSPMVIFTFSYTFVILHIVGVVLYDVNCE